MNVRTSTKSLAVERPEVDQQVEREFRNLVTECKRLQIYFHSLDAQICRLIFSSVDGCSEETWKYFCEDLGFDVKTFILVKVTGPLHSFKIEFWSEHAYNVYANNVEKEQHRCVQLWEILDIFSSHDYYFPVMKGTVAELKDFLRHQPNQSNNDKCVKIPEESSDLSLCGNDNNLMKLKMTGERAERNPLAEPNVVLKGHTHVTDISSQLRKIALAPGNNECISDSGFGSSGTKEDSFSETSSYENQACHLSSNLSPAKDHTGVLTCGKDLKNNASALSGYQGINPDDPCGLFISHEANQNDVCVSHNPWNPVQAQRVVVASDISILITHSKDACSEAWQLKQCLLQIMSVHAYCHIDAEYTVDPTGYEATLFSSVDIVVPLLSKEYFQDIQPVDRVRNNLRSDHSVKVRNVFERMEMQFRENQAQNFRVQPIHMPGITRNDIPAIYRFSILRFPIGLSDVIVNPQEFYEFLVQKKRLINENDVL